MLRPFYETLGEETPSGERPPPRSQPDQHDQALCELARGGRRQVHADPTRLEVLALSSSSRNPEPTRQWTTRIVSLGHRLAGRRASRRLDPWPDPPLRGSCQTTGYR